ncbi:MAG: sodium-translocating pyrophosphatase [Bacteroidetes bacterium]|nr:sodium-translocating pyrophosphatase [Bacteroidota bacterium]
MDLLYYVLGVAAIGLVYAAWRAMWVGKQEAGDATMQKIAKYIADGAISFLKAEYRVLALFVAVVAVLLSVLADPQKSSWLIGVAFVIGAFLSAFAGFIGMRIATKANVRTTNAARTSLSKALDVSFSGGMVMGLNVVCLGILGIAALMLAFTHMWSDMNQVLEVIIGFSLGAESIALFARVGGGIYTKAADVGADLVGKVEAGIPEDDPRNPATIADNVGDNVGDVAGMGADLFGSFVSTIIATMVLGYSVHPVGDNFNGLSTMLLPIMIAAAGILFSIIGSWFVRVKEGGNPQTALNIGNFGAVIMMTIASYFIINYLLPATMMSGTVQFTPMSVFYSVVIGLAVGTLVSLVIEYYTSKEQSPVKTIARQSATGAATNIISGLSVGMQSTAIPVLILAGGIMAAYATAGLYGVAIAASGMMATTGIQLAIDAFGPIADNAGGIAEMSHLPKEVRERTDVLDSVGNTTAAIGKGFAIASAALTSLAMFSAFMTTANVKVIDIADAYVLGGLLIGGMIPFLFSSFAIRAVGDAANAMVEEVRRQFREIKGILEGTAEADYQKCIEISTKAALRHMMLPGALAILSPVIIGFTLGAAALGGFLAGVLVSGVMMAFFQSNAGGAWDNAKKMFETGVEIKGEMHYKGSDAHKAAVVGDTVGDPFKDTSGPSLNILIKLVSIVAVVIAPLLPTTKEASAQKEVKKQTIEVVAKVIKNPEGLSGAN